MIPAKQPSNRRELRISGAVAEISGVEYPTKNVTDVEGNLPAQMTSPATG